MPRRKIVVGALLVGVAAATIGIIVVLTHGAHHDQTRVSATVPTTVYSSPTYSSPTFTLPPGTPTPTAVSMGIAASSGPTARAAVSQRPVGRHGAPAVSWHLTGRCTKSTGAFSCTMTVRASNGLQSAGFVEIYAAAGHDPGCTRIGALSHDTATVGGACRGPFAAQALAIYSLTSTGGTGSQMAADHLPWA